MDILLSCVIRLRKMMVLGKWKGLDYAAVYGFKNGGILLMGTIWLNSPVAYGLCCIHNFVNQEHAVRITTDAVSLQTLDEVAVRNEACERQKDKRETEALLGRGRGRICSAHVLRVFPHIQHLQETQHSRRSVVCLFQSPADTFPADGSCCLRANPGVNGWEVPAEEKRKQLAKVSVGAT